MDNNLDNLDDLSHKNHPHAKLNPAQKQAVTQTDGPMMILAGAGSGKTRTLVARIAHLLDDHRVSPSKILALTFSNKAAKEMRERVAVEVGVPMGALQVLTFHSFCAQVLRSEFSYLGLSRNFTIYDQSEAKSIIKSLLQKRNLTPKELNPLAILYYIDDLKNKGWYLGRKEEVFESEENKTKNKKSFLLSKLSIDENDEYYPYFVEYENELRRSNALDFGGLITGTLQLFETYPEILQRYQNKYHYLLVDEYQDTNRAQFDLIRHLGMKRRNICVVGDEDQSIYSWRGADIRNILEFDKVFPDVHLVKLEQNYRSSKIIIEAASCVIAKNVARSGKHLWTENEEGDSIKIVECNNDKQEAEFITKEIKSLTKKNTPFKDIAIFYRNNSQSRVLEEALRMNNLPYRVIGGIQFYERREIKDLLAYLRLIVNHKDSLSLSRIINMPARGIGTTTLRKIEMEALSQQKSLWEILEQVVDDRGDQDFSLRVTGKTRQALQDFVTVIKRGMKFHQEKRQPSFIYQEILEGSGYLEFLKSSKDYESMGRIDNLQELLNAIKQYEQSVIGSGGVKASLEGFLETITLDSVVNTEKNKDEENSSQEEGEEDKDDLGEISLMTIHGSKGLEFPYVFLIGVEENIFPSYKSLENIDKSNMALEEERRLFYVAMTRAMKNLFLSFAQARMLHGNMVYNGPSRFLDEIPENLYRWVKHYSDEAYHFSSSSSSFSRSSSSSSKNSFAAKNKNFNHSSSASSNYSVSKKYSNNFSSYRDEEADEAPKIIAKPQTFTAGAQVSHSLYGAGRVLQTEGYGQDEKVLIEFPGGVKKKFLVKYAPLSLIS